MSHNISLYERYIKQGVCVDKFVKQICKNEKTKLGDYKETKKKPLKSSKTALVKFPAFPSSNLDACMGTKSILWHTSYEIMYL